MRLRSDVHTTSDPDLVRQFLDTRSEEAFRALYRAHSSYLFGMAMRLVGSRPDAEEALQDTWIRAAERLEAFQWRSSLRTWLAGITLNCCREIRRRRRPTTEIDDTTFGTSSGPNAELLDLERFVAELPDTHREVLVLFHMDGCSHDEIGERLGIPAGTSKSRLFEARRQLRQLLDPQPLDAGDPS